MLLCSSSSIFPLPRLVSISIEMDHDRSIQALQEKLDAAILAKQHAADRNIVKDSNKDKVEEKPNVVKESNKDKVEEKPLCGARCPKATSYRTEGEFPEFGGVADCHVHPLQQYQGQVAANGEHRATL